MAVRSVDAFVASLVTEGDTSEVQPLVPTAEARRSAIATLIPGEIEMAAEFISLAWDAAHGPVDCEERRDARAWLQDHSRLYSARLCFETLGKDYDAVQKLLLKRWLRLDGNE